jgi:hypothetical protein
VQEDQLIATVESLIGSERPLGRPASGVTVRQS